MTKSLFAVKTPKQVIKTLKRHLDVKEIINRNREMVNLKHSLHRILAEKIIVLYNLPGFTRSTMDGYAIKAEDSFGVSDSLPSYLKIMGEIKMGDRPEFIINSGETVKISTGGMLPDGANAVIMLEYTFQIDDCIVEIRKSVAPGTNIIYENEDLKEGECLFEVGHKLKPQDVGVLAGIGKTEVEVFKKPKIAIISTGNEIISAYNTPEEGEIRDINSYTLGACVEEAGGIPLYKGIIKDEERLLEKEIKDVIEKDKAEIVVISGGSSVGIRDITLSAINRLEGSKILVHGVSVKPGKPTIIAVTKNTPIFGLPGNPVSAIVIFKVFVQPLVSWLQGIKNYNISKEIEAELDCNIASDSGREDYIGVFLYKKRKKLLAKPIFGKSGLLSTMVRASGLIKIELNKEGLEKGSKVIVQLF